MSTFHICNTFFEWELANASLPSLDKALAFNNVVTQLQFLPLLYGAKGDRIGTTLLPKEQFPLDIVLLSEVEPGQIISSWGYSKLIAKWAKKNRHTYDMPDWDLLTEINSKAYSFAKSPLPGARLLYEGDALLKDHLLKTVLGTAGRGHRMANHPNVLAFCQKEWALGRPILSEPWVEKECEFSTQWEILKGGDIQFLGETECLSTAKGIHRGNVVGDVAFASKWRSAIEEQKAFAFSVLQEMCARGYFGPVGFDALVYKWNGKRQLQPALEINARRTFGSTAIAFQKREHPGRAIRLAFEPEKQEGLLPLFAGEISFSRQIVSTVL